jgi:hypothetical protein
MKIGHSKIVTLSFAQPNIDTLCYAKHFASNTMQKVLCMFILCWLWCVKVRIVILKIF